jgi:uncharacterized membrane-anchored protein
MEGLHQKGVPVDTTIATALFVPVAIFFIWLMVRVIRKRHIGGE